MADSDDWSHRKEDSRRHKGRRNNKRNDNVKQKHCPSSAPSFAPSSQKKYDRGFANDRTGRMKLAMETLAIVQDKGDGSYTTKSGKVVSGIGIRTKLAVDNTQLYEPHQVKSLIKSELEQSEAFLSLAIEVQQCYVLKAAEDLARSGLYKSVAVLNFASAKNPGGGFIKGASAHEESIARSSGLYPCLTEARHVDTYYGENKKDKTCVYTDHMIFSPNVPVIRNDSGDLLEDPYEISIITAPAVNAGASRKRLGANGDEIIADTMRIRIKGVLAIAKKQKCDAVVLGAWGCGCFRNDPVLIAKLFAQGLRVLGSSFKKIIFAIDDEDKCSVFRSALAPLIERDDEDVQSSNTSSRRKDKTPVSSTQKAPQPETPDTPETQTLTTSSSSSSSSTSASE
eukprot:TRINITY_DN5451_c0_g1_i2.p1 TRINITY_DN5451_c0_g1~~TRINITY_DN5451_c0_g1_i2.p1  ORF type:complete len:397 (-),score=77.08 TRINITY_DN5451_c0_g1_i2:132-1322(-)